MEDEGRPFEVGFREQASNHPKRQKAVVVSVGGKDTGQVWITETSGSEPLMTCRKVPGRRRNQERVSLLGQGWEVADDGLRWTPALRQVAMRESCSYKRLRNRSSQ